MGAYSNAGGLIEKSEHLTLGLIRGGLIEGRRLNRGLTLWESTSFAETINFESATGSFCFLFQGN